MTLSSLLNFTLSTIAPPLKDETFWMPEQAATGAPQIDWIFNFILYLCYFFFVLIVVCMVVFVIRYRKPRGELAEGKASHNTPLEVTWTVIPLILVVAIFYVGMKGYMNLASPPAEAYEVNVVAQKWSWEFKHKNGAKEVDILSVPANQPVRLVIESRDVLHSVFIPAFRVKQDAVPGRYTELWFEAVLPAEATEMKEYTLFCTEYCGTQHSQMLAKVHVYPEDQFDAVITEVANRIDKVPDDELACFAGKYLYAYCSSCHTLDGTNQQTAPSWKGLWDRTVNGQIIFTDQTELSSLMGPGQKYEVAENYLRDSITNPQAHIVMNYTGSMPTFQGQLGQREITALVEFIKRLDEFVDASGNLVIPEGCGEPAAQAQDAAQ